MTTYSAILLHNPYKNDVICAYLSFNKHVSRSDEPLDKTATVS